MLQKHLLLTVGINLLYGVIFIILVQYTLFLQFEETLVALGLAYMFLTIITNLVVGRSVLTKKNAMAL